VPDSNTGPIHEHADNVKSVALTRPPKAVDPDLRRSRKLSALSPADRFNRAAEIVGATSFNLDEDNRVVAFCNQVDITVPTPKSATHHSPSLPLQPT